MGSLVAPEQPDHAGLTLPLMRIRNAAASLGPAEARLAEFILGNPEKVVYLSISELADACSVSDATIIRFCKRIGYRGYYEFKISLAVESSSPTKHFHENVARDDSTADILRKVTADSVRALQGFESAIHPGQFERAVDCMAAAGRIEIYGVGGSAFIADMAYHKWLKLGLSVIAITDPHIQLMSASLLTKRDVAIGISDSGTSVQIVYALEKARQSGAATIAITGHDRSPICKVSDIVLLTRATDTVETESLCRRAVQVNLIECLAVAVGIKNYEQSVETIRKTDAAVVSYKL